MTEGENSFSYETQPFEYLWNLANPDHQRQLDLPVKAPIYRVWLNQFVSDENNSPVAMFVSIIDLTDSTRILEAYRLVPEGVEFLQCQVPPLTGVTLNREVQPGEVLSEHRVRRPSFEIAVKVAEFIDKLNVQSY